MGVLDAESSCNQNLARIQTESSRDKERKTRLKRKGTRVERC